MTSEITLVIAKKFSRALDVDDFEAAGTLIDHNCVYHNGSSELHGPKAILASYREASRWGRRNLDEVVFESSIEQCEGDRATILFIDRLKFGTLRHAYRCKQIIFVSPLEKIHRIELVEIDGQRARLNQFFAACGLKRNASNVVSESLEIARVTKVDYDYLLAHLEDYWGERGKDLRPVHHPMFLYEFGDTAYVVRDGAKVLAYLFGFVAQTSPTAYVHLLGVHKDHRRMGLGQHLYRQFMSEAKKRGCLRVKAMTQPVNTVSIAFHKSIGMSLLGEPNEEGIPVIANYRGQGEHRVVFEMTL